VRDHRAQAGGHQGPTHSPPDCVPTSSPLPPLRTIGRFFVKLTPMGSPLLYPVGAGPSAYSRARLALPWSLRTRPVLASNWATRLLHYINECAFYDDVDITKKMLGRLNTE